MDAASYGWSASQPVLERLNPAPRVPKETQPKKLELGSWQRARREAVRREIEVFLKAEDRRQAGIKKLQYTRYRRLFFLDSCQGHTVQSPHEEEGFEVGGIRGVYAHTMRKSLASSSSFSLSFENRISGANACRARWSRQLLHDFYFPAESVVVQNRRPDDMSMLVIRTTIS